MIFGGTITLIMCQLRPTQPWDLYAETPIYPEVKEKAYKTLVRPIFEYSSTVWDPHTTADVKKIESVQRTAARTTLNCYRSVT